jgi:putative transposase
MPAKNARKQYLAGGYYHLYNRGVEKRVIFQDQQDYAVLLSYIKGYLLPKDIDGMQKKLAEKDLSPSQKDRLLKDLRLNNFADQIELLAYCLMPNHFHFFVKQKSEDAIDKFFNSLGTRYTMYFNKKYKRVGKLYQGVYKAVLVERESQFLYLSRYIHHQALVLQGDALQERQPCSWGEYIGLRKTAWIKPEEILSFFSSKYPLLSYERFVRESDGSELSQGLTLEED